MVYAVIDTNICVSALITHNSNASTARVLESLFLHRAKFNLSDDQINTVIELVKQTVLILPVFLMLAKCQMRMTESSMKSA